MPFRKFAQAVSAVYMMFVYFSSWFIASIVLYYFSRSSFCYLPIAYVSWTIYDNLYTPKTDPMRSEWFRKWPVWRWACEYFPIKVHLSSRYDPARTYICGYHPHGVMPNGAILGLSSNGLNVDEKLPGMTVVACHLGLVHWMPMMREVALLYGCMNVERATIRALLSKPGRMLLIVVGGAAESLEGQSGKYRLILKRRKGFVREALIAGSCLVPVFSFGENYGISIVKTDPASFGRKVQEFLKHYTGATIPLIKGRSVCGIPIPLFPHRAPLNIVFGAPIEVTRNPDPTDEEVVELHDKYMRELSRLFETNKDRFEPGATLEFI